MTAPPKNVEPSELWTTLSQRPRPLSKPIEFPCKDGSVGSTAFWILTEGERRIAKVNANNVAKELVGKDAKVGDLAYEEIYNDELTVQLLCMACRVPDDPKWPSFPSIGKVRSTLTTDEFAVLATAYANYRRDTMPILAELSPDEMELWIRRVQEGAERAPLALLSGPALTDLVMYLVSKLPGTSPTPSGSAGSPLDAPSTATSVMPTE